MIGVTSRIGGKYWIKDIAKKGFKLIEWNHRWTPIVFSGKKFNYYNVERKKHGVKFSFHSAVTDLLNPDEIVSNYQLLMLKSEIKYAPRLKIKDIVFHLPKYLEPTDKRINPLLKELLGFAKKFGVVLYFENDPRNPWGSIDNLLPLFKRFPSLKHCIDIGHLNVLVHNGVVKSEEEYFKMMGKYTDYVHLHGNKGPLDLHRELGSGNVELDIILPLIKKLNPKYKVIETVTAKQAIKTRELLKKHGIT